MFLSIFFAQTAVSAFFRPATPVSWNMFRPSQTLRLNWWLPRVANAMLPADLPHIVPDAAVSIDTTCSSLSVPFSACADSIPLRLPDISPATHALRPLGGARACFTTKDYAAGAIKITLPQLAELWKR